MRLFASKVLVLMKTSFEQAKELLIATEKSIAPSILNNAASFPSHRDFLNQAQQWISDSENRSSVQKHGWYFVYQRQCFLSSGCCKALF